MQRTQSSRHKVFSFSEKIETKRRRMNANLIDLVVDVKTGHVLPVSLDDVDELVSCRVLTKQNFSVENLEKKNRGISQFFPHDKV